MRHLLHHRHHDDRRDESDDAFHAAPQQVAAAWAGLSGSVPDHQAVIHATRASELVERPAA